MPKLSARDQKKVAAADPIEERSFEPLPAGKYIGTLKEVEVKEGRDSGNPYWNAVFTNIRDLEGNEHPGSLWYMLMLPIAKMPADYRPKSGKQQQGETEDQWIARAWKSYQDMTAGRIAAFYLAFGFTLDSDTEEFYGNDAVLSVGIETINSGPRKGERTNRVRAVQPLDSIDLDGSDDDEDDDEF